MSIRAELRTNFGPELATRSLRLVPDGEVTVILGTPRERPDGSWICPCRIVGIGEDDRMLYGPGVDAIDAIWNALVTIGVNLYTSDVAKQGRLRRFPEDEGPSNLGFPVLAEIRDLVPNPQDVPY